MWTLEVAYPLDSYSPELEGAIEHAANSGENFLASGAGWGLRDLEYMYLTRVEARDAETRVRQVLKQYSVELRPATATAEPSIDTEAPTAFTNKYSWALLP